MQKPDPIQIATEAAELARSLLTDRARLAELPSQVALYVGYDADAEVHLVQSGQQLYQVRQNLTTAGLSAGQPVELVGQNLDSTPRVRRSESSDFIAGESQSTWAVLLRERRFLGTVAISIPGSPPVFSPPIPASWFIAYSAGEVTNLPAELPRYQRAGSELLCDYGADDVYCTLGFAGWNYTAPPLVRQSGGTGPGFRDSRCHLSPDGDGNTIVIGAFAFSPDGVESRPSISPSQLPRVHVRIPGQPCGAGPQVDMNWRLIEITQLTEYAPPKLDVPAFPGGIVPFDRFDTAYWIYSEAGLQLVATVADDLIEEDSVQPIIDALATIDEQGQIWLDLRISRRVSGFEQVTSVVHYQLGAQPPTVPTAPHWRRNWVNSTGSLPLDLPYIHPCQATFQQSPQANLDEADLKLYIADGMTLAALRSGTTHKTRLYNLTPTATECRLPEAADEEIEIELPPLDFEVGDKNRLAVVAIVVGGAR